MLPDASLVRFVSPEPVSDPEPLAFCVLERVLEPLDDCNCVDASEPAPLRVSERFAVSLSVRDVLRLAVRANDCAPVADCVDELVRLRVESELDELLLLPFAYPVSVISCVAISLSTIVRTKSSASVIRSSTKY